MFTLPLEPRNDNMPINNAPIDKFALKKTRLNRAIVYTATSNPKPFDIFQDLVVRERFVFEHYHFGFDETFDETINETLRPEKYDKAVFKHQPT